MRVYYTKDEEHLPYILASGVWHYYEFTENVVNGKNDQDLINQYLEIQKIIKERINPAVRNPLVGEQFLIECDDDQLNKLLLEILNHYLDETKGILKTIEDTLITEKCLEDIEIIENRLIKAIKIAS